ncbi:MAG: glycerol-3-phosphate 1-O-acyltransferase PlsY [Mycoplasma sp.]
MGYLSGSILWSVIIGKVFFKKDLREFESKNVGATNSLRVYGKKVALVVLLLDIAKCMLPTFIIWTVAHFALGNYLIITEDFNPYTLVYITSLFSVIGHCYPIFFKFKGGKGASCLGAFTICISPLIGLTAFILWFIIMKVTKYVSLSSILTSWVVVILLFIPGLNWLYLAQSSIDNLLIIGGHGIYWILFVNSIVIICATILTIKHKDNIKRLINKEERKIGSKKDSK